MTGPDSRTSRSARLGRGRCPSGLRRWVGVQEAAAGPPAAVDAAGWKTIEEGANSEGRLVAYVSLTGMDPVFADFMALPRHQGDRLAGTDRRLLPRLDQELSVGAKGADVTFHASPGWFVDNFKAGNFSTLKLGPEAQESGAIQRVGNTNFAGVYGFPNVISYRTSQPKPENIKQLLDTNPQAKIGLVDPGTLVARRLLPVQGAARTPTATTSCSGCPRPTSPWSLQPPADRGNRFRRFRLRLSRHRQHHPEGHRQGRARRQRRPGGQVRRRCPLQHGDPPHGGEHQRRRGLRPAG